MSQSNYQQRVEQWLKNRYAPHPRPECIPTEADQIIMMPMRDNVQLYTELFLAADSPCPVILIRSPYPYTRPSRHDKRPVSRYLEAGYHVVFQLIRGQGQSEGDFQFFRNDSHDGYDCIDWIAQQTWCNGALGMEGASYLGGTQLLAAKAKHPALKCIMPTAFIGNCTQCFPFSYGVPNKAVYMQWHLILDAEDPEKTETAYGDMSAIEHPKWGPAFRHRPTIDAADNVLQGDKLESWRQTISNPTDNAFWEPIHLSDKDLAALDIPVFMVDGWYDMTIGPIDYFTRMEKLNAGRDDRYLLVGPWNHSQTGTKSEPAEHSGGRILPENAAWDPMDQRLAFFNRYLKGDAESHIQDDRVRVYITGAANSDANIWKNYSTFPAPNTQYKQLYLHSTGDARALPEAGKLMWEKPTDDPSYAARYTTTDQYIYNPEVPTAFSLESFADRRNHEIRSDVLTYTSAVLPEPITILGDIVLVLYAASDCPDTDWFAVITEVFPSGESKSFHYAPPALRARYRQGMDREVFLEPNKPEKFTLSMGPAGHQIAAGNRLRLSLFSSAFPEYDPNSNTGNTAALDTDTRTALQTVYHDAVKASHIVLPIIYLND